MATPNGKGQRKMLPETEKLTAEIRVYADPRLKQAAIEEARRQRCALSELVVRALADYLDEPELAELYTDVYAGGES